METEQTPELQEFLEGLRSIDWPEPLWRHTLSFLRAHGATRVSYHHIAPRGAFDEGRMLIVADGFDEDWLQRYISERLVERDPIVRHALAAGVPFHWSEIESLTEISPSERAFLDSLPEGVPGDGLAVGVYGPNGRNGYVGIGLDPAVEPLPMPEVLMMQMACEAAHLRYIEIMRDHRPDIPAFTEREREVLTWAARGKSNGVIGDILGISPATVDAHLRRIFAKLGANDRVTAVVRGLGEGVIAPLF